MVASVEAEDGEVKTLIIANKAGLSALRSKVYIDCTGDADLAVWAGADYEKGAPQTGELQPATHCFNLSNVDMYAYQFSGRVRDTNGTSAIEKILASGDFPEIVDMHACNSIIGPGTVGFNAGHLWNVDNTDPFNVSKALMKGRKIAQSFRDGLVEHFPEAFGNAWLSATGALMGIRETRRIIGDYVLSLQDFLDRRSFEDEICRNAYFIDVHNSLAQIEEFNSETESFENKRIRYDPGESHGIPYRCLTPKGVRNVLVAGRSISTDREVQGSTRVMPVCLAMGEAAGAAAAFAADEVHGDVHAVDVAWLRNRLREVGGYLP